MACCCLRYHILPLLMARCCLLLSCPCRWPGAAYYYLARAVDGLLLLIITLLPLLMARCC
jgi:hypothetical protein